MSISTTLLNANSGLAAASRSAETVAQNVANAMTEGYARREVELSSASIDGRGSGVRVSAITRMADEIAIADRRLSEAEVAAADLKYSALSRLEQSVGIPGTAGSLSDHFNALESAFLAAEAEPQSVLRHQNVLSAATGLAGKLNRISQETQILRQDADQQIGRQVQLLNTTLEKISEINHQIRTQIATGKDGNGLIDQRQELVDKLAGLIPLRVVPRDHDAIAIYSTGGAVLLDGSAATFAFTPTPVITADMTLSSGALSGLTLNGKPVSVSEAPALLKGGALASAFDLRDEIVPSLTAGLDGLAQNLIERFQDPALDATLASGVPGLFTDAGLAFDPAGVTGLAGRISINASVNPAEGGALWRLRDGLGAITQGPAGNSAQFTSYLNALSQGISTPGIHLGDQADDFVSLVSSDRLNAESDKIYAGGRLMEFRQIEAESGVDTDSEMQKLLLIEHVYAANARVIQTVDDMLRTLLDI